MRLSSRECQPERRVVQSAASSRPSPPRYYLAGSPAEPLSCTARVAALSSAPSDAARQKARPVRRSLVLRQAFGFPRQNRHRPATRVRNAPHARHLASRLSLTVTPIHAGCSYRCGAGCTCSLIRSNALVFSRPPRSTLALGSSTASGVLPRAAAINISIQAIDFHRVFAKLCTPGSAHGPGPLYPCTDALLGTRAGAGAARTGCVPRLIRATDPSDCTKRQAGAATKAATIARGAPNARSDSCLRTRTSFLPMCARCLPILAPWYALNCA